MLLKHTNKEHVAQPSLPPPPDIYKQQLRGRLGVDSDLAVAIGWSGGQGERWRDRDTLVGHTLAFNNNPEEDAP